MKVTGLIIASGYSSRMTEFKPLLKFKEHSFLITIVQKVLSITPEIVIVTGYNNNLILSEIENYFDVTTNQISSEEWNVNSNIKIVHNSKYHEGMFTSLQTGIRFLSEIDWILYHFVDQPSLPFNFYRDFIEELNPNYEWIQPQFGGHNGHPILLSKNICSHIKTAEPSTNLKMIRDAMEIKKRFWKCDYPQILQDIDTDEDYKKLLREI